LEGFAIAPNLNWFFEVWFAIRLEGFAIPLEGFAIALTTLFSIRNVCK
jgi:hypothetical protein